MANRPGVKNYFVPPPISTLQRVTLSGMLSIMQTVETIRPRFGLRARAQHAFRNNRRSVGEQGRRTLPPLLLVCKTVSDEHGLHLSCVHASLSPSSSTFPSTLLTCSTFFNSLDTPSSCQHDSVYHRVTCRTRPRVIPFILRTPLHRVHLHSLVSLRLACGCGGGESAGVTQNVIFP